MAIPGLKPSFDIRAKVRVGEKRKTRDGKKEFPASVDYFVCDDPLFKSLCGEKPKELAVRLAHEAPEDNFSTGLEQWQGQMLVCYAKGDDVDGVHAAYRKATMKQGGREIDLLHGFDVLGPTMGNDRRPVRCAVRACAILKRGDCKPMGRLQFYLAGADPAQGLYQLDTKSWNTIEKIEGFLKLLGDPRGKDLVLRVEMWSRGTSKFPVVSLEGGPDVEVNNEADVKLADALVQLHKAVATEGQADYDKAVKLALAAALDVAHPGWRTRPDFIERIKEVGADAAAKGLLERNGL